MSKLIEEKYRTGKQCPYCNNESEKVDSIVVYGRSYGDIYFCKPCHAYVGCHPDGSAKGSLANSSLREARKLAHFWFDQIAKTKLINKIWKQYIPDISNRNKAYLWLSKQMGIDRDDCHIGMMDENQCKLVQQISENAVKNTIWENKK